MPRRPGASLDSSPIPGGLRGGASIILVGGGCTCLVLSYRPTLRMQSLTSPLHPARSLTCFHPPFKSRPNAKQYSQLLVLNQRTPPFLPFPGLVKGSKRGTFPRKGGHLPNNLASPVSKGGCQMPHTTSCPGFGCPPLTSPNTPTEDAQLPR